MATKRTKRFDAGGAVENSAGTTYSNGALAGYPFVSSGTTPQAQPVQTTIKVVAENQGQQQPQNSITGSPVTMMKKGGKVTASRRGDGIAQRGKTRGRMV
jgi:hypothetical protein